MAYLLEDLKTNGAILSSHLITGVVVGAAAADKNNSSKIVKSTAPTETATSTSSDEITIDISDCPVFDGVLRIERRKRWVYLKYIYIS